MRDLDMDNSCFPVIAGRLDIRPLPVLSVRAVLKQWVPSPDP